MRVGFVLATLAIWIFSFFNFSDLSENGKWYCVMGSFCFPLYTLLVFAGMLDPYPKGNTPYWK